MSSWNRRIFFSLVILSLAGLFLGYFWIAQPTGTSLPPKVVKLADPERLKAHVKHLSADLSPRVWTDSEQLAKSAAYIEKELLLSGGRVWTQEFSVSGAIYKNVSALFGPAEGERVVVGAHYDAFEGLPGADDNASGIAGILELARMISRDELHSPVEIVAYALEEPPHFASKEMGSAQHVAALQEQSIAVRAMICLEMIGYFSDAPNSQRYPIAGLKLIYPGTGNFIGVVGNLSNKMLVRRVKRAMKGASPLEVYSISAPVSLTGVDLSDHRSYWSREIPAIMITDTAFFRNDAYHTSADTWDRLDYPRMANVVTGVRAAVLDLASRSL